MSKKSIEGDKTYNIGFIAGRIEEIGKEKTFFEWILSGSRCLCRHHRNIVKNRIKFLDEEIKSLREKA
jgi:hypothetical protein